MKRSLTSLFITVLAIGQFSSCSQANAPATGTQPDPVTGATPPAPGANSGGGSATDPNDNTKPGQLDPGYGKLPESGSDALDPGSDPSDSEVPVAEVVPMSVADLAENMSGIWRGSNGGHYYLRHDGNVLLWYGENKDLGLGNWSQVGVGKLLPGKTEIEMNWYSLPSGLVNKKGKLRADLQPGEKLTIGAHAGDIGEETWTREKTLTLPPLQNMPGLLVELLPPTYDLTGVWKSDDGGRYYIRQEGSTLVWYGENKPVSPGWANLSYGTVSSAYLHLKWADMPKGQATSSGRLDLKAIDENHLLRTDVTGGFGGSKWIRVLPDAL